MTKIEEPTYRTSIHLQGDHNWTMKNPKFLADISATEETMIAFENSWDPNEMPCDTASQCDPYCLTL